MRIIAYDSNYVHYGNGRKLLEYKIGTPEFIHSYRSSGYLNEGNNGRYYDIHSGSTMLQHTGKIGTTFRNLKAKELTAHPFQQEFKDGIWPDTLAQDFVFTSPTTHLTRSGGKSLPQITAHAAGSEAILVSIEMEHTGFEVRSLGGRSLVFQKTSGKTYLVEKGMDSAGLLIVRIGAGGRVYAKILGLP